MTGVLQQSFEREASELRDKVFAVLGATGLWQSKEDIPALVRPDYDKPIRGVYRDATRYCVTETRTTAILRKISHQNDDDVNGIDFPSWVPRYDRKLDEATNPSPLSFRYMEIEDLKYIDRAVPTLDPESPDVLILTGVALNTIKKQSNVFDYALTNSEGLVALRNLFHDVFAMGLGSPRASRN